MDAEAKQAVPAAARDIVLVSTVFPNLIADTGAFLIRATIMVRDVSLAYGHRPSRLGLVLILRHMFRGLGWLSMVAIVATRSSKVVGSVLREAGHMAAVTAGVAHPGVAAGIALSTNVAAKVADNIAVEIEENLTAAIRMAQLGMLAMRQTRPIVPSDERSRTFAIKWSDVAQAVRQRNQTTSASLARPSVS